MANKVVLQSIEMITYSGSRVPAYVGALLTGSFTNLAGQFVGGGRIQTVDRDWILKVDVTDDGNGIYHSDPFEGEKALSATRWNGVDQDVRWNFYLLDSNLNVIKTLYENIVIANSVDTTTIQEAVILTNGRYFPKNTSYPSFDDLYLLLANINTAPDVRRSSFSAQKTVSPL